MSRLTDIVDSVDHLIHVHDAWQDNPTSPDQPTQEFADAVQTAIDVANGGDTPAECRELVTAIGRLEIEWSAYERGNMVSDSHGNYRPSERFWAALRAVFHARTEAEPPGPRVIESVATLIAQKVGATQIAKIYGSFNATTNVWSGPFFGSRGEVLHALIEEESKTPGSVIGKDWVHPSDESRVKQLEKRNKYRLSKIREREENAKPKPLDVAKVIKSIEEGAYVRQIAKENNISEDDVRRIANEHSLQVAVKPDLMNYEAPPVTAPEEDEANEDETPVEEIDQNTVNELIIEMAATGQGAPEIARSLTEELGHEVTAQQVAVVLRENRTSV